MKKILVVIGMMMLLMASGCLRDTVVQADIALILSDTSNPFFATIEQHAQSAAKRKNLDLLVFNSGNDYDSEMKAYTKAVESGVKVIIMNPVDEDKSSAIGDQAEEDGIYLILIDRKINSEYCAAFIRSDNRLGGQLAGALAKDLITGGQVLILEGIQETSANDLRIQGFLESLPATIRVKESLIADFNRQKAYDVLMARVDLLSEVDLIFCTNDEMALGVVDYMKSRNFLIPVIGFDGTNEALRATKYGYLAGTIAQQADTIAEEAMEVAHQLLKGLAVERHHLIELDVKTSMYRE